MMKRFLIRPNAGPDLTGLHGAPMWLRFDVDGENSSDSRRFSVCYCSMWLYINILSLIARKE